MKTTLGGAHAAEKERGFGGELVLLEKRWEKETDGAEIHRVRAENMPFPEEPTTTNTHDVITSVRMQPRLHKQMHK